MKKVNLGEIDSLNLEKRHKEVNSGEIESMSSEKRYKFEVNFGAIQNQC